MLSRTNDQSKIDRLNAVLTKGNVQRSEDDEEALVMDHSGFDVESFSAEEDDVNQSTHRRTYSGPFGKLLSSLSTWSSSSAAALGSGIDSNSSSNTSSPLVGSGRRFYGGERKNDRGVGSKSRIGNDQAKRAEVFEDYQSSREWTDLQVFQSRLDRLIARKVMEGVKFHILLYRDVELFLPNASSSAKKKLLTKALFNRNLQIMRHAPEGRAYGSVQHWLTCSLSRGKTWWSHHEKVSTPLPVFSNKLPN
jgi:hypothetical protein